jgi:hypothetical protein
VDFTIRIFVNPRYAPSLILGQWAVRSQQPEWVGAPQKRFAWAIGFVLAATMLYLVVIQNVIGPVNVLVCAACLVLLFFEAAFGICIGCKVYNLFNRQPAQLCPGGVCELPAEQRPRLEAAQVGVVVAFVALMIAAAPQIAGPGPARPVSGDGIAAASGSPVDTAKAERCKVPKFAKAIGHEAQWKLHNNCR